MGNCVYVYDKQCSILPCTLSNFHPPPCPVLVYHFTLPFKNPQKNRIHSCESCLSLPLIFCMIPIKMHQALSPCFWLPLHPNIFLNHLCQAGNLSLFYPSQSLDFPQHAPSLGSVLFSSMPPPSCHCSLTVSL